MSTKITRKPRTNVFTLTELGLLDYYLTNANSEGLIQHSVRTIAKATGTPPATVHLAQQGLITKKGVEVITPSKNNGRGGDDTAPVLRPKTPSTTLGCVFGRMVGQVQVLNAGQGQTMSAGQLFPIPAGQEQVIESERPKLSSTQENTPTAGQEKAVCTGQITYNHIPVISSLLSVEIEGISPKVGMGAGQVRPEPQRQSRLDTEPSKFSEPYKAGQRDIPSSEFDVRRVPMCVECGLETVDFFDYRGHVTLEHFCNDETCGETWRERRHQQELEEAQ